MKVSRLPLRRPRYADIVATLALFIALGGTAYAVTQLDPNSVYTAAIQNQAVTAPKLANEAVNSAKIEPGAVNSSKLANQAVTSPKIADHAVGSAQLAPLSVSGSNLKAHTVTGRQVAAESLTLANLVGINESGKISFVLHPQACGLLQFSVHGAKVGQSAILTYSGRTAIPRSVVIGPLRVVKSTLIQATACDVSNKKVIGSGIGVRIITFS